MPDILQHSMLQPQWHNAASPWTT